MLRDLVSEVVVCDPRRNKLLAEGSKGDKPDARRLAELLRAGMVRLVWHGHEKTRTLLIHPIARRSERISRSSAYRYRLDRGAP